MESFGVWCNVAIPWVFHPNFYFLLDIVFVFAQNEMVCRIEIVISFNPKAIKYKI